MKILNLVAKTAIVCALAASITGCVTTEDLYKQRVASAVDSQLYSAFYPNGLPAGAGYDVQVYDGYLRITRRFATVDFIGEAETKYLQEMNNQDPVLETYLDTAIRRGSQVKVYKGLVNPKLFATSGALDFWPDYRKMSKEDPAYIEFDKNGSMRSALIRRAAFSSGSLGIGVYREQLVLVGQSIRSIENRVSNRDLDDSFLKTIQTR